MRINMRINRIRGSRSPESRERQESFVGKEVSDEGVNVDG